MATYIESLDHRESVLYDLISAVDLFKTGEHDAAATMFARSAAEKLLHAQTRAWEANRAKGPFPTDDLPNPTGTAAALDT